MVAPGLASLFWEHLMLLRVANTGEWPGFVDSYRSKERR